MPTSPKPTPTTPGTRSLLRHPVVAVLASWFVSLGGLQIASDATWKQIATPGYVFGALVLLGGALLGLNGDRPWGGSK